MPTDSAPARLPTPAGGADPDWSAWIQSRRDEIEAVFDSRLPAPLSHDDPGRLVEAMRYSLLGAGKRLRPLLALAAAEAAGEFFDSGVRLAAAAVELIHCYSLVHDDLPAMDDDDFRRGKPSNHKVYGEATAILAGDGLLTLAFAWLAEAGVESGRPRAFGRAALALARGAGVRGMVRGQARDLAGPPPTSLEDLERLHGEKTAALFRAAIEVGAEAGGATPDDVACVARFGEQFGIAFQHADDLDDADHPTHAESARARVTALVEGALASLERLSHPERAGALRAIAALLPTQTAPAR